MKLRHILITLSLVASAFAWNCPAGQIRVQAPAGTPTTTPYYDVVEGIAFVCAPATPPSDPTSPSATSTSQANSTSSAAAGGGNASSVATGGGGGSVNGSGNSTNTNTISNRVNQNQNQSQNSQNTNTNSNQSAGGYATAGVGISDVGNSVTNIAAPKIPVTTAYAPTTLPSAPCVKNGFGAGAQTMVLGGSFGQGGRIDEGCDAREDARAFFLAGSRLAGCKMLVSTKAARKAHVTLEDCMTSPEQKPVAELIVPRLRTAEIPMAPVVVQAPAPQILVIQQPIDVTPTKAQLEELKPKPVKIIHHAKPAVKVHPCIIPESLKTPIQVQEK